MDLVPSVTVGCRFVKNRCRSQDPPLILGRFDAMPTHSKLWYLQRFRLLDVVTPAQKRTIDKITRMFEVKRGQRIYVQGDASDRIFLLKIGVVRISAIGADEQETVIAFLSAGDIFGELAIVEDSPREDLATAHEDVLLCELSRDILLRMAQETPALGYEITKVIGRRLRRFRTRIEELLCKSVQARLARTLLNLASDYGIRDQHGVVVPLRLNQADLGNLVGVARETVNIVLQDFKQRGLVEAGRRSIRIIDPVGLRTIA
jgi:CRP-like cAMP-binding protein